MPTHDLSQTTVQLTVVDLYRTTTTDPKTRPGTNGPDLDINAEEFARSSTQGALEELPVTQIDRHGSMNHTGLNDNTPFFMVRAGVDLFDQSCDTSHTRAPEQASDTEGTKAFGSRRLTSHMSGRMASGESNLHSSSSEQEIRG